MNQIEHQPLNYHQNNLTPITNWKLQDNPSVASVGKSPFAPLYGEGPGYTAGKDAQSITLGAGSRPIEGGMSEDGRLTYFQGTSHNLNSHTHIENKHNTMTSKAHNNNEAVWNGTSQHKYNNNDWAHHIYPGGQDKFDPARSGNERSWKHSYNSGAGYIPVASDDPSTPLEAGPADLTSDENHGNHASIPQYKNQGNSSYNVTKKAHPTDALGSAINMLSNVATKTMAQKSAKNKSGSVIGGDPATWSPTIKKEIVMAESKDVCTDPNYPYFRTSTSFTGEYCAKEDIPFEDSITKKEFCYVKDKDMLTSLTNSFNNMGIKACDTKTKDKQHSNERISNKLKAKVNLTDDQRKYYDSKVNEDKRKYQADLTWDRNQIMVDNNRTPININMSCNQGRRGGYYDEYGYSGYGTSNLYNDCVYNNQKCYADTLNNWYGDMSASNNVYRRRQRWRDRDYYREGYGRPNYSLTHAPSNNTEIGAPYSTYTPYSAVSQPSIKDSARDTFNVTSARQN